MPEHEAEGLSAEFWHVMNRAIAVIGDRSAALT